MPLIFQKLGLGLNIINKAKTMIGTDEQEINSMIESLEKTLNVWMNNVLSLKIIERSTNNA